MGLFDKFDNIYDTNISASQVCNMKVGSMPYEEYDEYGRVVGYFWHYGDTIELDFEISGEVIDGEEYITAEEYLQDKNVRVSIYNFRYDSILEREIPVVIGETTLDGSVTVKLIIDEETSKKILRGTYYITVTIFKDNEAMYLPIIKGKNCKLTVI